LILALKKHAVHNAITIINNSLMLSKIVLIVIISSECFSQSISVIISNKIFVYFSKGIWESAASSPGRVHGGTPEAKAFLGFA